MKIKNKKKTKIRRCPFCGSDAELIEVESGQFTVVCTCCQASTGYYSNNDPFYLVDDYDNPEDAALDAWNNRFKYEWKIFFQLMLDFVFVWAVSITIRVILSFLLK